MSKCSIANTDPKFHWNYFLSLDDDIAQISRYVELSETNYTTFSIELVRLYLSIGSEIDVVAKALCARYAKGEKVENIGDYCGALRETCPLLFETKVFIPRHNLIFVPWGGWDSQQSPPWWRSYNDVKHRRSEFYEQANLGNVLQAAAGLFVFLLFCFPDEAKNGLLSPEPKLFVAGEPFNVGYKFWREPGDGLTYMLAPEKDTGKSQDDPSSSNP